MKSTSNRLITIETSRTVVVRQTSRQSQDSYSEYNRTAHQGADTTDFRGGGSTENNSRSVVVLSDVEETLNLNGGAPELPDTSKSGYRLVKSQNGHQDGLNDLFNWLHQDRDLAGIRYEEIRRALIKLFACRGAHISEDLADETIDRVVKKLPQIRESYRGRPIDYFCGVARNIYHEYSRKNMPPADYVHTQVKVDEEEFNRLDRCLDKLTPADRSLILEYYYGERKQQIDRRKEIAERIGIPMNALRIRAYRIRAALQAMMLSDTNGQQNLEM